MNLVPVTLMFLALFLVASYCNFRQLTSRRLNERMVRQQSKRERLVNQITQQIRRSLDLDEVLATTVSEVQRLLQADRVLIYRLWDDGTGSAIHETVLSPYPKVLGQTFPPEVFPKEFHLAYSQGKVRAISNIEQTDVISCLAEFVKQFGVRSKLVVPILQENRGGETQSPQSISPSKSLSTPPYLWGLLIAHQCSRVRVWNSQEVDLMKQLANQVAIAIQQSELYKQLQLLNTKLEERVQNRTEELAQANSTLRAEIKERQRTEAELRYTNDTLQTLVTASPRAIIMLDLEGKVKIWNPAAEQMFGWTEAEVFDRPSPIGLDETTSDYPTLQSSVLQGTTYSRVELSRPKKDGTLVDIIFSAAPLLNSAGEINGIVAVITDITEQKQREEQIRLLQSVVIHTNDGVIITEAEPIDEPGPRIIYVNEAFTRITGYEPHEVIGKTPRILQGPKTDFQELKKIRNAFLCWDPVTVEVINYRKDGTEYWNEFSIVPVGDKSGSYTHWIAVQRDTTSRKQVEQALRQSEERFRSLIENALDIIMILDSTGAISYLSPSVEKILGYGVSDLIGRKVTDFIHPDNFVVPFQLDQPMDLDGSNGSFSEDTLIRPIEFSFRHRDGTWRILEAVSQRFFDRDSLLQLMVNARDITERKRLDEIRLALEREKELNTLKTRFFSMVSHEFRTPLSTVLAAAQVLENSQGDWDNSQKRFRNLHRIQDSVKNMVQLLDDILIINRAETGKLEFKPTSLDLVTSCLHLIDEMQLNAGSAYNLRFSTNGNNQPIFADEKLLRSILSNLISNAIKYSPQGGDVFLSLEFESNLVVICVKDFGVGIHSEDLKLLFEPFQRGRNVRAIPGTGLGLVVVKKFIDLHQGSIRIVSQIGQGTTCWVTLPL